MNVCCLEIRESNDVMFVNLLCLSSSIRNDAWSGCDSIRRPSYLRTFSQNAEDLLKYSLIAQEQLFSASVGNSFCRDCDWIREFPGS